VLEEALETVRVTAQRVQRFAANAERDPQWRPVWRAALSDLRVAIRRARAEGGDVSQIRAAAGEEPPGRFTRPPKATDATKILTP
jgi:hypothetical protein